MNEAVVRVGRQNGVALVRLNRPDKLNALNETLLRELNVELERLAADDEVRVVVLTGEGRAFSSGQDLTIDAEADYGDYLGDVYHPLVRTLAAFEKPLIAALHGVVAGAGLSLALAADVRIVAEGTRLSSAFINIGLVADAGGPFRLRNLLRHDVALDWLWSGRTLDVDEAERIGLVTHRVAQKDYESFVREYAERLAARSVTAVRGMKQLLRAETLETSLDAEIEWQRVCGKTEEHHMAIRAFMERASR